MKKGFSSKTGKPWIHSDVEARRILFTDQKRIDTFFRCSFGNKSVDMINLLKGGSKDWFDIELSRRRLFRVLSGFEPGSAEMAEATRVIGKYLWVLFAVSASAFLLDECPKDISSDIEWFANELTAFLAMKRSAFQAFSRLGFYEALVSIDKTMDEFFKRADHFLSAAASGDVIKIDLK